VAGADFLHVGAALTSASNFLHVGAAPTGTHLSRLCIPRPCLSFKDCQAAYTGPLVREQGFSHDMMIGSPIM